MRKPALARWQESVEMQANPVFTEAPAGASEGAAVVMEGVEKQFGRVQALRSLSARIHYGRLTGLVGPDGAGKTR